MSQRLTHIDQTGAARMVDVGEKPVTHSTATAEAFVRCSAAFIDAIRNNALKKGDLLGVARIAGIMAAKGVDRLIPLCHTLPIEDARVELLFETEGVCIIAFVATSAKTGVEMEALTAATIAALTVIDMGKALDRSMSIERVRLLEKTGGRRGDYRVSDTSNPEAL